MKLGDDGFMIIEADMWCYNCEHEWITDDYYKCNECPECKGTKLYKTNSFSFAYAYLNKHPELKPKQLK